MLKIAVFGFYSPDQPRPAATDGSLHLAPVTTLIEGGLRLALAKLTADD
jgi:hypothetical protein